MLADRSGALGRPTRDMTRSRRRDVASVIATVVMKKLPLGLPAAAPRLFANRRRGRTLGGETRDLGVDTQSSNDEERLMSDEMIFQG